MDGAGEDVDTYLLMPKIVIFWGDVTQGSK